MWEEEKNESEQEEWSESEDPYSGDEQELIGEINAYERVQGEIEVSYDGTGYKLTDMWSILSRDKTQTDKDIALLIFNSVFGYFQDILYLTNDDKRTILSKMYLFKRYETLNAIGLVTGYALRKNGGKFSTIVKAIPKGNNVKSEDVIRYYRFFVSQ